MDLRNIHMDGKLMTTTQTPISRAQKNAALDMYTFIFRVVSKVLHTWW